MLTLDDRLLLELTDHVYAAALDSSLWEQVAGALGAAFDARFSLVFGFQPSTSRVLYSTSWGLTADVFEPYAAHYSALDVRMPAALRGPAGTVVTEESLIDAQTYHSSAIYNEYLRPMDCEHLMAVLPQKSNDSTVIVSVNRSTRVGPFDSREREFFGRLVPHLRRAVALSSKLATAEVSQRLSRSIMDRAHFGILALAADGRVIDANPVAEACLRDEDALVRVDGRLCAVRRSVNDKLQLAVAATARIVANQVAAPAAPILVPRAGRPLRVLIAPLTGSVSGAAADAAVMVAFIFTQDLGPIIAPQTLSVLYGLTPAEARVAAKLAEGRSTADIARLFVVSPETVRTHLKRTLSKMQCESQSALVREIVLGAAQLMSRESEPRARVYR